MFTWNIFSFFYMKHFHMPRVVYIYININVKFTIISGQMKPDSLICFLVVISTAGILNVGDTFLKKKVFIF